MTAIMSGRASGRRGDKANAEDIMISSHSLLRRHSGAMRSIEPGSSRFRVWCVRTIPE
jgi:hypothetical protein